MRNYQSFIFSILKILKSVMLFGLLVFGQQVKAQTLNAPPEMVFIEGGSFKMGCTEEQEKALIQNGYSEGCKTAWVQDELPVHEVSLRHFYIGKYEITQSQWAAVMPKDTLVFNVGMGVNYPVYHVSWYDAVTFCNRLSVQEGFTPCYYTDPNFEVVFDSLVGRAKVYVNIHWNTAADGYRLPIEAEWEYAARGGQSNKNYAYSGSDSLQMVAVFNENNKEKGGNVVGSKSPNGLGLYDLSGNEWEWTWDGYLESYYENSPECQPIGPLWSEHRVCRGGNWRSQAAHARIANRIGLYPGLRTFNIGFRVARGKMKAKHCMEDRP
jgi:formylglycine-generating enzyme required for sulfatase activity